MIGLLLLLGCTDAVKSDDTAAGEDTEAPGDPCLEGDAPELVIGVGEAGYEPLAEGSEVPLIFGPQGGYHIVLALAATYLNPEPVWTVTLTGLIDGEQWGRTVPYAQARCDGADGALEAWNLLLIWDELDDPDPNPLDGQTLDITMSVEDLSGTVITAETAFVLRYGD